MADLIATPVGAVLRRAYRRRMTSEEPSRRRERPLDELYRLRRSFALVEHGERAYSTDQFQRMRRRRNALEILFGADLDASLAAEAGADAMDRLSEIAARVGIGGAELRELLRISPAELRRWQAEGMPDERRKEFDEIRFVAQTATRFGSTRAADAMRTPIAALGGRSIMELLAAGRRAEARAAMEEIKVVDDPAEPSAEDAR